LPTTWGERAGSTTVIEVAGLRATNPVEVCAAVAFAAR
jgi:hypothetical protein